MAKLLVYTLEVGNLPKAKAEEYVRAATKKVKDQFGKYAFLETMVVPSKSGPSFIQVLDID
jgi:hypothetical protein